MNNNSFTAPGRHTRGRFFFARRLTIVNHPSINEAPNIAARGVGGVRNGLRPLIGNELPGGYLMLAAGSECPTCNRQRRDEDSDHTRSVWSAAAALGSGSAAETPGTRPRGNPLYTKCIGVGGAGLRRKPYSIKIFWHRFIRYKLAGIKPFTTRAVLTKYR